ncbi:hypothetical protein JQC91_01865 [Jannaschia sp. Os4]|uniref:hypothetical protein n=1 Tax=Jannaschia sp. Os4 TaxID=2807617 RepID=UPI00193A1D2C|nr:hypothetical protein [Jannaschia sp. Os4]MBM2575039.1 hypothetical protein [Jannaschia sp. Os4]
MRSFLIGAALAVGVAGCGGGGGGDRGPVRAYAEGPIRSACLGQDRRAATSALCGCVQAAADRTLSAGDQRRSLPFYRDPHRAQEVRQSDRARDEAFWTRYKQFVDTAERMCA